MVNQNIRNKVQALWDRLWSGGLSNPITAIEQISFLLFMKRLQEFHSATPKKYRWSEYHNLEGNKLIEQLEGVFHYIKNDLSKEDEPFAKAMQKASFTLLDKPATLVKDAVQYVDSIYQDIDEEIRLKNQPFQDIQGDLYEHLLRHTSEAGKNGQFRTPRHLIQLMAELLEPDLDGRICDLASGSAGFLVGAYQYILTKHSNNISIDEDGLPKGSDGEKLTDEQIKKLKKETC